MVRILLKPLLPLLMILRQLPIMHLRHLAEIDMLVQPRRRLRVGKDMFVELGDDPQERGVSVQVHVVFEVVL